MLPNSFPITRPLYILPNDPFTEKVLIPCFRAAASVDTMVGFFSSHVLGSIAPGLATFINETDGKFRLIVSPVLSEADWNAIKEASISGESLAGQYWDGFLLTEDAIERHTLRCLTWLLETGRVEIKIALMKEASFHLKVWLFTDGQGNVLSAHGSSNATQAGVSRNIEQVAVSTTDDTPDQHYVIEKLKDQFSTLWSNEEPNCVVVGIPEAVKQKLIATYSVTDPPEETDLQALYKRAVGDAKDLAPSGEFPSERFQIPPDLEYQTGPYAHQGAAVDAWCEAGYRGIMEMATGAGKTIAAMISAHRLFEREESLLTVIAAPFIPLIEQWCGEVERFGITPTNITRAHGPQGRARELGRVRRRIQAGSAKFPALIVSHNTLSNPVFQNELRRFDCPKLLIADEAHNLGSEGFITNPPEFFDYRLGLSATPVRQYDDLGTAALLEFLGPVIYRYTLEDAIGNCLVGYDYYVHPVELTPVEMDEWHDLTMRIKQNAWRDDNGKPDDYLAKLLRDRRVILENADNKIDALKRCLAEEDLRKLRHTLIYTSEKDPEQLESVNGLLKDCGVLFRQFTYEETAHREDAKRILKLFQRGDIRVLTAKRVLDEGVNIPEIQKAFILASTTVERQWIQRRGRLLRKCAEIGKTHSVIHDFIALPPDLDRVDGDAKSIIRTELTRVQEFARLARNAGRPDGALAVISQLASAIYL